MRRTVIITLLVAVACLAQTKINPTQINFAATFASPPGAPTINTAYLFIDASVSGLCTGGGSSFSWCVWNGSSYTPVSAGFPNSIAQGGTGATTAAGALTSLLQGPDLILNGIGLGTTY